MKKQTGISRPGRLNSLKRRALRWSTLLCTVLMSTFAHAGAFQQTPVTIKGHVSEKGATALPGVTITLKGSSTGTTTDENGNFSISLPNDAGTLLFSYVGYLPKEVAVKGKTTLHVSLEQDATGLGEVVVVGYGTQKKVNLTGAVEQISSARLTGRPVTQLSTALQGIAPGVTVTTTTGAPGADAGTIRIRGIGTLNNANPLILIDGVEGNMNELDPNMIESVSVLKDAASSAIYGSRAANGVVLVTTKRAKGDQLGISYNGYVGWQSPTNLPDKVDAIDHMQLLNVAYKNTGLTPLYTDAQIDEYRQKMITDPDNYPNTDWQKEVLTGSGVMQNHYVGISGASGKLRCMTSLGYLNQEGIIKSSGCERYTLRNNADIRFNDKLSIKLDLQLINRTTTEPGRGMTNVFLQMNRIPAVQPGRFLNGQYGEGWNGNNPIAMVEDGGRLRDNTLSLFGNLQLNYQPTKWLTAELMAAPRFNNVYENNFVKAVPTYTAAGNIAYTQPAKSELTNSNNRGFYGNYRANLTAHKVFGQHETKLMAGASRETYAGSGFSAFRDNYLFPQYPVQDAGSRENMQTTGDASEWALQSFFGRFNYSYRSRYLFEANARYDGSSRFLRSRRYGFFPSFSAGWRVSEENFLQFIKPVVNDLKLRGSWGKLGNQNIGTYPFASNLAMGAYSMGGEVVSIAALNDMGNEEITWETTTMTNFGVDVA
ncbi:MAG: SusC/RagA family TonB-linked outer membrane protein, partial [Chitinophaga sp.]